MKNPLDGGAITVIAGCNYEEVFTDLSIQMEIDGDSQG